MTNFMKNVADNVSTNDAVYNHSLGSKLIHFFVSFVIASLMAINIHAAPFDIYPAPSGIHRMPEPNVILTVDDSTEMNKPNIGIKELKQALSNAFLINQPMRLAWQSMNGCQGFMNPINKNCSKPNTIKRLSKEHKLNFNLWINSLKSGGSTPGHLMVSNAGEYLTENAKNSKYLSDINGPFSSDPGTSIRPTLSCRPAYHIYISGSSYNTVWSGNGPQIDTANEYGKRIFAAQPGGSITDDTRYKMANLDGGGYLLAPRSYTPSEVTLYPMWQSPIFLSKIQEIKNGRKWVNKNYNPGYIESLLYSDNWGAITEPMFITERKPIVSTLSDLALGYYSFIGFDYNQVDVTLVDRITNYYALLHKQNNPVNVDENFGTTQNPAWLNPINNPKNNPGQQPRMVHYTIGMGSASQWIGPPYWQGDTYSGLGPLIRGEVEWPSPFCGGNNPCDGAANYNIRANERKTELWHMALNSRGKFFTAPDVKLLESSLQNTLKDIKNRSKQEYNYPVNSSNVVVKESLIRGSSYTLAYLTGYDTTDAIWSGKLSAHVIDRDTLSMEITPTWEVHKILDYIDNKDIINSRNIITTLNGYTAVKFSTATINIQSKQNMLSDGSPITVVDEMINYIIGDRRLEQKNGGYMRDRNSRLGTIVNSKPWVTKRPSRSSFDHYQHRNFRVANTNRESVIYVGANDGMLHGFNADDGKEIFAYIPISTHENFLYSYTQLNYLHQYSVDGSPFTGDVDISMRGDSTSTNANWRTILFSGMGAGARGYFILDVTNPSDTTLDKLIIDKTTVPSTVPTKTADDDIGHIFSQPVIDQTDDTLSNQIVKMNNGRWAVVLGNGYNSINERPVLIVQYVDGDRAYVTIVAQAKSTLGQNGLAAPRIIDVNSDGKVDIAYAGDLLGQLWKFDLSSENSSAWKVANNNKPLFIAVSPFLANDRQPITTAPVWMVPPTGGLQIAFGTGVHARHFDARRIQKPGTIYSILDDGTYSITNTNKVIVNNNTTFINGRNDLFKGSMSTGAGADTGGATSYGSIYMGDFSYSGKDKKRGWLADTFYYRHSYNTQWLSDDDIGIIWPNMVENPIIYDGQKVLFHSKLLNAQGYEEICYRPGIKQGYASVDGKVINRDVSYIAVLNMFTGQTSKSQVFQQKAGYFEEAAYAELSLGPLAMIRTGTTMEFISPHDSKCPVGTICPNKFKTLLKPVEGVTTDWRNVN